MSSLGDLYAKAATGTPLTMVNAYDSTTAKLVDESDIDSILIGDSLAITMLGYDRTDQVTLDEMIHHGAAVGRTVTDTYVVFDLPFGSYNVSPEQAVENANRVIKETGADAVKVEGGLELTETVRAISEAGIDVFGHIGILTQTTDAYDEAERHFEEKSVRGRTAEEAELILESLVGMEAAGAVGIFLVRVAREVAEKGTESVDALTIGVGSGPSCDMQMLSLHDVLGLHELNPDLAIGISGNFASKFVDHFNEFHRAITAGEFPTDETSQTMEPGEANRL